MACPRHATRWASACAPFPKGTRPRPAADAVIPMKRRRERRGGMAGFLVGVTVLWGGRRAMALMADMPLFDGTRRLRRGTEHIVLRNVGECQHASPVLGRERLSSLLG